MKDLYETKVSDARWIAYDIPGNIGWIAYLMCLILCLREGVTSYSIVSLFPMALMLLGIGELISERIAKLDRILPRKRLLRGFSALTLGGIVGVLTSAFGMAASAGGRLAIWMLIGSALCGLFAGLLLGGYRRMEEA